MEPTNNVHERVLVRMLALSDGIFAFAITLLILNVVVPEGTTNKDLPAALANLWPKYEAFLISFVVIGLYWFVHVRQFRQIRRFDERLLWLNLLFLLFIVIIPFSTSVLSNYTGPLPVVVYAAIMACAGFTAEGMWLYASLKHRLVSENLSQASIRRGIILNLISPIVFTLSIGIAFINAEAAQYSWISIAVFQTVARQVFEQPKADENI